MNAQVGQTYYIYSPGYPRNYTGARQCRWIGICPSGYQCRLDCPEISLPASSGCSVDRLLISRSGDPQLNNADVYCGKGSTTALSISTRISIGLITSAGTPGGKFYCEMTTQAATLARTQCSCGYKKSNRIVGGQETGVNEYTMMAGVIYLDQERIRCGGTIIDKRYVMTAAHCVAEKQASDIAVVVGEHNITTGANSPARELFNVERIVDHPQYTASNYDYDIAILRLDKDIVFTDRVGPACMPFKFNNTDFTGKNLTLLGWGTESFGGPPSKTLMKVDVAVISQSECKSAVASLTDRQICTLTSGKDACQDDSGGPALYTDPSSGLLYACAVISNGYSCADDGQPGVNTRVPVLLDWVLDNTPGANYCRK